MSHLNKVDVKYNIKSIVTMMSAINNIFLSYMFLVKKSFNKVFENYQIFRIERNMRSILYVITNIIKNNNG